MFEAFQLAAIVGKEDTHLLRIPMHQSLQDTLSESWLEQFSEFSDGIDEVDFDAGYQPEAHERFRLNGFELPAWLKDEDATAIPHLDAVNQHEDELDAIRAIAAFVRHQGSDLILFQDFTRSHVIRPGRFLFLTDDTYKTQDRPGLTLDAKIAAVYFPQEQKLLFRNFRAANTFLPLNRYYREASANEIREILGHDRLAPEDIDAIAANGETQWFRKRFAMLRDSRILDDYDAQQILNHSQGYEVAIRVQDGKIVFPSAKDEAKRLLQFLNEELFRGAITETLYETNSKREAD